jgi:hypothetical protein
MSVSRTRKARKGTERPVSAIEEISVFLLWLTQRWAALALGGLVLATVLWTDFLREFDLPVSFITPGLLSALPVLGLAVGLPVLVGTLFSVLMAVALWTPIHKDGPSLVAWASASKPALQPGEDTEGGRRAVGPDLFNRWISLCVVHAGYWVCYVGSVYWHFHLQSLTVWGLAYAVPMLVGLLLFRPVFRAASDTSPSLSYLGVFCGCVAAQATLAGFLVVPHLASVGINDGIGVLLHLEMYVYVLIGVGIAQLFAAKFFLRGWRPGALKGLFIFTVAAVAVVMCIPGLGGQFVSYRLRLNGPGHQTCIVLTLRQGQLVAESLPPQVLPGGKGVRTVHLDFVTRLDDAYYVKPSAMSGPTYVVPANAVSGFESCGSIVRPTS